MGLVSKLSPEVKTSKVQLHHVQGPEHLHPLYDGVRSPSPPEAKPTKVHLHHVQGQEHLQPLHDGAESPRPPEVGECNHEGHVLIAPVPLLVHRDTDCQDQLIKQSLLNAPVQQQDERHVNGHVEGQPLAPIPLQTSKDDCQDQLDQQLLLQQGDRHANGHVKVSRQVQCETTELCKTLETFTSDVKLVKVVPLTYFEELLIRNRACA